MGLSYYNIKKWLKMVSGRSILHVNQGPGLIYSKEEIKGYYNDLTQKVLRDPDAEQMRLPEFAMETGKRIHFSIQIFQYGLGAYDLYLLEGDSRYLRKFKQCLDWAIQNMHQDGGWDTFSEFHPHAPYSSMAQGEGVSLLLRGYAHYDDETYLAKAVKAVEFMLISVEDGGTSVHSEGELLLKEYTHLPTVLNGWIFSLFGLYDFWLVTGDMEVKASFDLSIRSLCSHLNDFDCGYWSQYDMTSMLASPFYHSVHIAQLEVLYSLTGIEILDEYRRRFEGYRKKRLNRLRAFVGKAIQKIVER